MIYGITGYVGSGKDTVVDFLLQQGFEHASLSDEIRLELKKNNIPETREALISCGNNLRHQFGADILAKRALSKIKNHNQVVLSSIRNIEEINFLKSQPEFKFIFVEAPQYTRFARIIKRNRIGDTKTFAEFVAKEKQEESADKNAQQMHRVKDYADIIINNNSTLENLYKQIKEKILI